MSMHTDDQIQKIKDVKDVAIKHLLTIPGVTGVDIGFKYTDGVMTDKVVLRVHVKRKRGTVAKDHHIPTDIMGIPTDVIESFYQQQDVVTNLSDVTNIDEDQYDVLDGGISISGLRPDNSADTGTLGLVVTDNRTGKPVVLTNAHVVGGEGTEGKKIYHPYPWSGNLVGSVLRARRSGSIDAAIISIDNMNYSFDVMQLGGVQGTNLNPQLGMVVRKRGRQSRVTKGMIEGIHGTFPISATESYDDIMRIKPLTGADFSIEGDSGSVVLDENNSVIGLLYAGYPSQLTEDDELRGRTLVIPIQNVMTAMNISIGSSDVQPTHPVSPPVVSRPTLRLGVKGPAVMELQQMLKKIGFGIVPDGSFGPRTQLAVKVFQTHNNLQGDGIVGPMSWRALEKAVSAA
jgi:hypothetical protein